MSTLATSAGSCNTAHHLHVALTLVKRDYADVHVRGADPMSALSHMKYSFVIPVYDEALVLPELTRRLTGVMERLDGPTEVVFVNDGSSDDSLAIMLELSVRDDRFRVVNLSRNFGHQVAVTAGLEHAAGRAVVILDADLQDPPEVVLEMAQRWREGYDVVYGLRETRIGETWLKRVTAAAFYRLLGRLTDIEMPVNVGDFRLVDRRALDSVLRMPERNRYLRGMFSWVGFRQIGVPYARDTRYAGTTKYPLRRMLRFAGDAVFGFSDAPLRMILNLGFVVSLLSFACGVAAVVIKYTGAFVVPGWTSILVVFTFVGGVQLIILGIMGEYVSRIYDEVKRRPLYLVSDLRGAHESPAEEGPEAQSTTTSVFPRAGTREANHPTPPA